MSNEPKMPAIDLFSNTLWQLSPDEIANFIGHNADIMYSHLMEKYQARIEAEKQAKAKAETEDNKGSK